MNICNKRRLKRNAKKEKRRHDLLARSCKTDRDFNPMLVLNHFLMERERFRGYGKK